MIELILPLLLREMHVRSRTRVDRQDTSGCDQLACMWSKLL